MIPNHADFIQSIQDHKKLVIEYYSTADTGVLSRVRAPMDYGPGFESKDGIHPYWVWDYAKVSREVRSLEAFGAARARRGNWMWTGPAFWPPPSSHLEQGGADHVKMVVSVLEIIDPRMQGFQVIHPLGAVEVAFGNPKCQQQVIQQAFPSLMDLQVEKFQTVFEKGAETAGKTSRYRP